MKLWIKNELLTGMPLTKIVVFALKKGWTALQNEAKCYLRKEVKLQKK